MEQTLDDITRIVLEAKERAYRETDNEPEPNMASSLNWPIECTVGPGLEGAIACETRIGYVNGAKGWLIYRGYDIFDLCAYSSFEETSFLLLHGKLPSATELETFSKTLRRRMFIPKTQRLLLSFPVESMNPMAALRLGTNLMRQKQTYQDHLSESSSQEALHSDDDSIAMETVPEGKQHPVFQFLKGLFRPVSTVEPTDLVSSDETESCYNLIAGVASVAAAIGRAREGRIPLEPLPDLSFAGNYLYMLTGRRPTPLEERIMDVCLILHADHGMNASTFASMVVASTLSDIYLAIGAGISALSGPLHGGANVEVVSMLERIGKPSAVKKWYRTAMEQKKKVMGFGHRVYKAYDPRARILGPLAGMLATENPELKTMYQTALALEQEVVAHLGDSKKIFPNVDFFSGIVYRSMGIPSDLYTTIFAVSRVSGWCARVMEYIEHNRIFRPRALYTGRFDEKYVPLQDRS
ncbi:citrate/2-methylcitrate synthase [Alkalispirochaeta alkalica]|uniref:citrate/2-methylcitrate synthase n=1 Tax=Alkalispirochaeta alkalica TaxID=46356 RepID=UPI00036CFE3D|nr:citrate/2-methylcitrate synthase [Alkalispirochaeta alkalica]